MMKIYKDSIMAFNGKNVFYNAVVLSITIFTIAVLFIPWIVQMNLQFIILPKGKTFKYWKKEEMRIETHYPGMICHFLCNSQEIMTTQLRRFRENFEPEWCALEEDNHLTHEQIHEKYYKKEN